MSKTAVTTIGLVIFAAVLGALWFLLPGVIHGAWALFRATWVVFIPIAILVIAGLLLFAADNILGAFAWGAAIVWAILAGFGVSYMQGHKLSESVTVSDESADTLSFRERAPFDVAVATSNRTLGDTTGDATGKVKALPAAGERGEYTTSVIRRGAFKGYESTQTLTPPLFGSSGSGDVRFCKFDEDAELRFGGAGLNNNLGRAIHLRTPIGTGINSSDAFVVCEGDTPKVYAPLTKQKGFAITQRVPAGVAIYNGKTGELNIEKEYDGELPVYPSSIAEAQRKSTTDSGSFFDSLFSRAGWEDTGKDEQDPNGVNRAEFGLASEDGTKSNYVTPLNSRGSSSSIVAVGVSSSSTMKTGELNDYTVYRYETPRQANSSVAASITGETLGGYKAQGLAVFEIVPSTDGTWVASIGKAQSILYRASIDPEGKITLIDQAENADGGEPAGEIDLGKPLEDMTDEALKNLGNRILEELSDR